jgi:T4 RnlA family RNA ligase
MNKIPTLEQCREICKTNPEFREITKPGYIVFDYAISHSTTFDNPLALEMRGIAFHADGKLAGLPLHKFFNYGEKPVELSINGYEDVLEKLDGSMVRPIVLPDGSWVLGTRAGETEVSKLAQDYIESIDSTKYKVFIETCIEVDAWPIFEFWSPRNSVVLKYDKPFLKLLAVRGSAGNYWNYENMVYFAKGLEIPCVARSKHSFQETLDSYASMTGIEGFVVRTDTGWVKLKTAEYCQLHKTLDGLKFDKDVARMIIDGTIDDALALTPDPRKSEIESLRKNVVEFIVGASKEIDTISTIVSKLIIFEVDRKSIVAAISSHKYFSQILKVADGKSSVDEVIYKFIHKNSATIPLWEKFTKENLL